jgi:uncharacterized cupin superfamily protein
MATIAVFDHATDRPGYPDVFCRADGPVTSSYFDPEDTPLWALVATLADGATLTWDEEHGDEVVRVLEGSLDTAEGRCNAGDVVLVESGVATSVRAVGDVRLLHYGSHIAQAPIDGLLGAPASEGHRVHLMPRSDAATFGRELDGGGRSGVHMFADSTCPTCRLTLLEVTMTAEAGMTIPSHVHSQDELIHVLDGTLRSGRVVIPAGSTVFIPGDMRYGLRADGPYSFTNYRRDLSTIVLAPGDEPSYETVAVHQERAKAYEVARAAAASG